MNVAMTEHEIMETANLEKIAVLFDVPNAPEVKKHLPSIDGHTDVPPVEVVVDIDIDVDVVFVDVDIDIDVDIDTGHVDTP